MELGDADWAQRKGVRFIFALAPVFRKMPSTSDWGLCLPWILRKVVTMTWALCLQCGNIKHGALCPCLECHAGPTGTPMLDIIFSDHKIVKDSLRQLGAVIAEINRRSDDPDLCRAAFFHYLSIHHPSILEISMPEADAAACQKLLDKSPLPSATIITATPRRVHHRDKFDDLSYRAIRWWFILPLVIIAAGLVYFLAQETPLKVSLTDRSDLAALLCMVIAAAYLIRRLRRSPTAPDADKEDKSDQ